MGALIFIPLGLAYKVVATILFLVVFVSFLLPLYAYIMFSQSGGKLQEKIYDVVIKHLGRDLKGDAASLDFSDNTFDGAISNLTFHEVKYVTDKRLVLKEALRVVKLGGSFSFADYFFDQKYYGNAAEFEQYLRDLNLAHFEHKHLQDVIPLPKMLRHPKILGKVGVIFGKK